MDIMSTTRSWVGTPYKHQHMTKGQGCDCLGLVRGVYLELYGEEPEKAPRYSPSWGEVGEEEKMIGAANRHLVPTEDISEGTVLMFQMRPNALTKHCAIVTQVTPDLKMVHAVVRRNVEEVYINEAWLNRVTAMFNFPPKE